MKASVCAMPFKSAKQRRYLHMIEPELAKRWEEEYGSGVKIPKNTNTRKSVATAKKKTTKKQGYNDRLDESLGERNKKNSQSKKDRRDESKGAEKAADKPAYSGNKSSNQGAKKKKPAAKKKKKAAAKKK